MFIVEATLAHVVCFGIGLCLMSLTWRSRLVRGGYSQVATYHALKPQMEPLFQATPEILDKHRLNDTLLICGSQQNPQDTSLGAKVNVE